MTDRPILFSAPMVRALLAGTKTQTRRIVKPQPDWLPEVHSTRRTDDIFWPISGDPGHQCGSPIIRCPYGAPGDILWARETLRRENHAWTYAADGADVPWPGRASIAGLKRESIPSIHMRRDACRLMLEITEVRVERLNDCSWEDAVAEGLLTSPDDDSLWLEYGTPTWDDKGVWLEDPRRSYRSLWEQINGPGSWRANPWVWAISFKRVTP